jgi:phage-related baseplate assembly protein
MSAAPWPDNLPPLEPLPTDVSAMQTAAVTRFVTNWLSLTGQNLALSQSDPRYQFLLSFVMEQILQNQQANLVFNQNFLPYMTGAFLDWWGSNFGAVRDAAETASVDLTFTLGVTSATPTTIPDGTQVSTGGNSTLYFSTDEDLIIPALTLSGTVSATCNQSGTIGNDFAPGTLVNLTTWSQPFATGVTNLDTSEGGADAESNAAFAARLYLVTDSFSVAGPPAAYLYFIYESSSSIGFAVVWSPSPCVVNIQFINTDGSIPNDAEMSTLLAFLQNGDPNQDDLIPTTDQVFVIAPYTGSYGLTVYYKVKASNQGNLGAIQLAVQNAVDGWITWQESAIGRNVDTSYLNSLVVAAQGSDVGIAQPSPWIFSGVPKGQTQVITGFTTPAAGASVTFEVINSSWMTALLDSDNLAYGFLLIPSAGLFGVTALPDGTHVTITNLSASITLNPPPVGGIAIAANAYIVAPPILGQESGGVTVQYQGIDYGK